MDNHVRVPIRVRRRPHDAEQAVRHNSQAVVETEPAVTEEEPVADQQAVDRAPVRPGAAPPRPETQETEVLQEELESWRDRALRLQAEAENFRKRQQRLANDQIQANRARLLRNFLTIADDLERAMRAQGAEEALREGVVITYRSLEQLLRQEGVEQIEARGETFDPTWHEAVGMVPHQQADVDRDTVAEVIQEGYRLDGRLLRPARVIVAK